MSGFERPNYTQAPNAFFDKLLPLIDTMTELKVTLAIMRKTMGWGKEEDQLSLSQLETLTGLRREGVVDGIKAGLKRGSITRRKVGNTYTYSLKVVARPDQDGSGDGRQTGPSASRQTGPTKETPKEKVPPTEGSDEPREDRVALLVRRCEEVDFHPTPKQKQTWGNELGAKSRQNLAGPEFMRLVVLVSKAAGEGYFWSLSKAERELGKPRGRTSIGPAEPVNEASDEEKANPYDLRAYLDRKKRRAS